MRVLIAGEFSGKIRNAFSKKGHHALSCDFLPSESPGNHYIGNWKNIWSAQWDLIIFHPSCTHLAVSGARHFKEKIKDGRQDLAVSQFMECINAPAQKICVENPICIMSRLYKKPDQIIQPWQFGHGETKATCLWLKGLSKLIPTNIVNGRESRIHRLPPSKDRWKIRSETYDGIAEAMAEQWG